MGLSEEEEKRGMTVCPKDHEKSSLCGGGKEVELHSTCAQSVRRVFKRLWKVQSQSDASPLSCTLQMRLT